MIKKQFKSLVLLSGLIFALATNIEAIIIDRVPALVDNMEDGDGGNRWSGVWYTFADGTSTVSPAAGAAFYMAAGGSPESPVYAARIDWALRAGVQYPFVGIGTNLSSTTRAAVDCSAYNGVRLWARGTGRYQLQLVMRGDMPGEDGGPGDFASYRVEFEAPAAWTLLSFNWTVGTGGDFRLPTWAAARPFDPTRLAAIAIQPVTPVGTTGELFIDDLAFLPYTPPTARETRTALVLDDCNDGDSVNALGGFWHTYSDAPVGTTVVDPLVGSTFTMTAGGAQNTAFGAKMSWTLDSAPPPDHPIAGMGTILGPSATDVLDARNYAGIRVFARGTRHHILRLVMPTDTPTITGSYQVGIPPSADWTEYVFSWGDFSLPAWVAEHGTTMANYPLDISRISAFQVQSAFTGHNPSGTQGEVSVDEIAFTGIPAAGNRPPNAPETPSGATAGIINTSYTYTTFATDPDGHQVRYIFDWGDGTTSETTLLVNSGTPDIASHSWSASGTYSVRAMAIDAGGLTSEWSTILTVVIGAAGANQSPLTPSRPVGPATGIINTPYTYTTSATDPNGNQVRYIFDWGDGTTSETASVASGQSVIASRAWSSTGTYSVRVRAIDEHGAESGWSTTITVRITAYLAPPADVVYPTDSPFNPAKGEVTVFRNLSLEDTLEIYTLVGELVRTLNESNNEATWDGKDEDGNILPSGVYFFIAGDKKGKVVILR